MDEAEFERITGKLFLAVLPAVLAVWCGIAVLEWLVQWWIDLGYRARAKQRAREEFQHA